MKCKLHQCDSCALSLLEASLNAWLRPAQSGWEGGKLSCCFSSSYKLGSEVQRVSNSRAQLGPISQSLSKLLMVLPLFSPPR